MHHLVFGINFQIHTVSLTSLSRFTSSSICQPVSLIILGPRSHHPSLLHSFTPGSKPTFSTNPSHLMTSFYLLDCLRIMGLDHHWTITLVILFLVSHFNFLFIPCGRLSWVPVSILLHIKYTTYCIVSYDTDKNLGPDLPSLFKLHEI